MPYHPHPHIIICTSFHLINWLQLFYPITMSLKRPFVPKSDVKQWFTATTWQHTWRHLQRLSKEQMFLLNLTQISFPVEGSADPTTLGLEDSFPNLADILTSFFNSRRIVWWRWGLSEAQANLRVACSSLCKCTIIYNTTDCLMNIESSARYS